MSYSRGSASSSNHRNWKGYRLRGIRKRDRMPDKVDSILRNVLASPRYHERLSRYSFVTHWHEIVGSKISQHARPLKVVRGALYVEVENPIWAQELTFHREVILSRIQEYVPSDLKINDLRFVVTDSR
jgi:hypothetical protein